MSFLFRFHSLLKLRRHKVASEKQKMHKLRQEVQAIEEQIDHGKKALADIQQKANNQPHPSLNAIKNKYQYIHNKKQALLELHEALEAAKEAAVKQKSKLVEASKNVKVLEKLEAREKLLYYEAQQEEERKKLNEIATSMYNRANETWIQSKQD